MVEIVVGIDKMAETVVIVVAMEKAEIDVSMVKVEIIVIAEMVKLETTVDVMQQVNMPIEDVDKVASSMELEIVEVT